MTTVFSMKRLAQALFCSAAIMVGAQAQAAPFSFSQSISHTNPSTPITGTQLFEFTSLPTSALTAVSIRIFGVTDVDEAAEGEGFEYFVDGISFGTFTSLGSATFDLTFQAAESYVSDGNLTVKVVFTDTVNASITGDFITTNISYRADDGGGNVPEPGTLALLGLALTGLALRRPKGIKPITAA